MRLTWVLLIAALLSVGVEAIIFSSLDSSVYFLLFAPVFFTVLKMRILIVPLFLIFDFTVYSFILL